MSETNTPVPTVMPKPIDSGSPDVFLLGGIGVKECSDGGSDDDDRTIASDISARSDSENIQALSLPQSGLTGLWRWEEVTSELAA